MEKIVRTSSLIERDLACIWHPFTQMQTTRPPIPIEWAKGAYLYGVDGTSYLDGISSWWVNLHGHAHPYIIEKITAQAEELEHVIFAGFTHLPAVELAERLLPILPGAMSKIFYSDNGSTAVEAALKIALQYWYNQDPNTQKTQVICFKGGYHGDTFGAMSAAGRNGFNRPFWKFLFEVNAIDLPTPGSEERSLDQMKTILEQGKTACFIFEPLILGAGGMRIYSATALNALLELCQKYNVLTIADEVMTGFGRTNNLFASSELKIAPDIICLSKGITGGFLPLGATACKEEIFKAFLGDTSQRAFLHGHSYTANPIACRCASASLDLLEQEVCDRQREMIGANHRIFCQKWSGHPKLSRSESIGTILALEYRSYGDGSVRDRLYQFFLERGILIRPLGNVLYVLPPYCIEEKELKLIYDAIILTLEGDL